VCQADVPRGAKACGGCGASHDSGWNEEAETSGLDLPDEEFDYGDFVAREFGEGKPRRRPRQTLWTIAGVVLLVALGAGLVLAFRH
jgi:hypothetical protein